jgi:hypothetical protein
VTGGKTGGARVASIRDDGNATTSLHIKGTHTNSIIVESTAGSALFGTSTSGFSTSIVEIVKPSGALINALVLRNGANANIGMLFQIGGGSNFNIMLGGAANALYTGSALGDGGVVLNSAGKKFSIGGAAQPPVLVVEHTSTGKLGFFNVTPVVQPAAVADASGGTVVDVEARTALNALLARFRTIGLLAA